MFPTELKYILKHNRAQIRILLGILLIPAFYAVIFLASLWNPYQQTKNLPVAVVNEDQSVTTNGTSYAFGHEVTNSLKQNKTLKFEFFSASKAHRQLNEGKVYLILQIPKNFSKQLLEAPNIQSKPVHLPYYTSAGHSFVAMKMSTTAVEKIQTALNAKISKLYLQNLVQATNRSGAILKTALATTNNPTQLANTIQPEQISAHLIDPIHLIHHDATHVKNNGTGMAPYLMSVALFVGSITLNIIYDTFTPHKRIRNGWQWWLAKLPFLYIFIFFAATIMFALLVFFCGLQPLQLLKTYGFVLLTAFTFLSMVTFFNLLFGMTGAWLMLLFMIIQLGGSAGTYPIQLSNHFFQNIHPYLPMTISVNAFRSTVSIGNSIQSETLIFAGIFLLFNLGMVLFFQTKIKHKWQTPEALIEA